MWVITHTLSGMALGALLYPLSLWLIVPAALLLHLILDLVPHWDYTRSPNRALWASADVAVSVAALVLARGVAGVEWVVVIAGVVSALPDLDVLDMLWSRHRRRRVFPSHWRGFPHGSATPVPGIAVQFVVWVVSVAVLRVT